MSVDNTTEADFIERLELTSKEMPENYSEEPARMEFAVFKQKDWDFVFISAKATDEIDNDDGYQETHQEFVIPMTVESFKRLCKMFLRFDERISKES